MKNEIKEAFDQVHAEENLKQQTQIYIKEKLNHQSAGRRIGSMHTFATACICFAFIVIAGFGGYKSYFTSVSAISIDVNPSIELKVNRFDKVIAVDAFNKDGENLSNNISLKYKNYKEAIDSLLESSMMQEYLTKNELVYITVLGSDEEKTEKLYENVRQCSGVDNKKVNCGKGNWEEVQKAHEAGMSFGKYKAFLELQELDHAVNIEDVKTMTMRQIRNRIAELTGQDTCNGKKHSADCEEKGNRQYGKHKNNGKYQ